jgi:hypothetical protein
MVKSDDTLESGVYTTIEEIAAAERINSSYAAAYSVSRYWRRRSSRPYLMGGSGRG